MKKTIIILVFLAFYVSVFVACKDDAEEPFEIKVTENATHGKILTDDSGRTLYFFAKGSLCEGTTCLTNWPVFYKETIRVKYEDPNYVVNAIAFSTLTRADGAKQTLYNGKPLYYYKDDTQAGDIKGNGVNESWYVAKPDYSLFYSKSVLVGHDTKSYVPKYDLTAYTSCGGTGEAACEEAFYLSDSYGFTLYSFKNDKQNQNNYTGSITVWLPFYSDLSKLKVPSILAVADFKEIEKNGLKQLTYKGWPLYYFKGNPNANPAVLGDDIPGKNRGISFPSPGVWPIVNKSTQTAPLP
jgi:predicted lipoprotein with Yx(FWY)xxD motif